MTAHTPGPWDIMFNDDVERIRLNGSTLYQVADVTDPDFPTGKPRYNLADLRLMAAAPELLAALCEARDAFAALDWEGDENWRWWDATRVDSLIAGTLHDVNQAIAKAEGRRDGEDRRVD